MITNENRLQLLMGNAVSLDPPKRLKRRGRELWRAVLGAKQLPEYKLPILENACLLLDAADKLQRRLRRESDSMTNSRGTAIAHWALKELRGCMAEYRSQFRELGLDALPSESRPPYLPDYR